MNTLWTLCIRISRFLLSPTHRMIHLISFFDSKPSIRGSRFERPNKLVQFELFNLLKYLLACSKAVRETAEYGQCDHLISCRQCTQRLSLSKLPQVHPFSVYPQSLWPGTCLPRVYLRVLQITWSVIWKSDESALAAPARSKWLQVVRNFVVYCLRRRFIAWSWQFEVHGDAVRSVISNRLDRGIHNVSYHLIRY